MELAAARCKSDQKAINAAQNADLYPGGLAGKNGSIDVRLARVYESASWDMSYLLELMQLK